MNVPSITSPALRASLSFNTVTVPFLPTNSIRTVVASRTVTDFSLVAKSPRLMVAMCVFESGVHRPIVCGCFLAYSFTAAAARRSEFPSRSTGFTPLARTQRFGEIGEYSPGERNVSRFDRDAGPSGEFPDDRQQRVGGQRRRFVHFRPHDLPWIGRHACPFARPCHSVASL